MTDLEPNWVYNGSSGWIYGPLPGTRIRQPLIFNLDDKTARAVVKLLNQTEAVGPYGRA